MVLHTRIYYLDSQPPPLDKICSLAPVHMGMMCIIWYWNCISHFSIVGQADEANFKSEEFGRDETSFDLEWVTESISEITKFKLQYKDDDFSNEISDDKSTSWKELQVVPQKNGEHFYTGKITLKNLSKASRYVARVSSKNDYGYSKYSQPFRFGTKGAGESLPYLLVYSYAIYFIKRFREVELV